MSTPQEKDALTTTAQSFVAGHIGLGIARAMAWGSEKIGERIVELDNLTQFGNRMSSAMQYDNVLVGLFTAAGILNLAKAEKDLSVEIRNVDTTKLFWEQLATIVTPVLLADSVNQIGLNIEAISTGDYSPLIIPVIELLISGYAILRNGQAAIQNYHTIFPAAREPQKKSKKIYKKRVTVITPGMKGL